MASANKKRQRRNRDLTIVQRWEEAASNPTITEIFQTLNRSTEIAPEHLTFVNENATQIRRALGALRLPFGLEMKDGLLRFVSQPAYGLPKAVRAARNAQRHAEMLAKPMPTAAIVRQAKFVPPSRIASSIIWTREQSAAFYISAEWRKLRYQALLKSNGCCEACGRSKHHGIVLHVDHVKPISKYPHLRLVLTNLQILCEDCNLGKSAWDETDWREADPRYGELRVITNNGRST